MPDFRTPALIFAHNQYSRLDAGQLHRARITVKVNGQQARLDWLTIAGSISNVLPLYRISDLISTAGVALAASHQATAK
jgi:hypothetical protein